MIALLHLCFDVRLPCIVCSSRSENYVLAPALSLLSFLHLPGALQHASSTRRSVFSRKPSFLIPQINFPQLLQPKQVRKLADGLEQVIREAPDEHLVLAMNIIANDLRAVQTGPIKEEAKQSLGHILDRVFCALVDRSENGVETADQALSRLLLPLRPLLAREDDELPINNTAVPWSALSQASIQRLADWSLTHVFLPSFDAEALRLPAVVLQAALATLGSRTDFFEYWSENRTRLARLNRPGRKMLDQQLEQYIRRLRRANLAHYEASIIDIISAFEAGELPTSTYSQILQLLSPIAGFRDAANLGFTTANRTKVDIPGLSEATERLQPICAAALLSFFDSDQWIAALRQSSSPSQLCNIYLQTALQSLNSASLARDILSVTAGMKDVQPNAHTYTSLLRGGTILQDDELALQGIAAFDWPEEVQVTPQSTPSTAYPLTDTVIAAYMHYLTAKGDFVKISRLVAAVLPTVWSLLWRPHFFRKWRRRALAVQPPANLGPEVYVAMLNVALKMGRIGFAQRIWHVARVHEARSQRMEDGKSWYLPAAAYTIMLQLCAQEAKHGPGSRMPFVKGWDLGSVDSVSRRRRIAVKELEIRSNLAKRFAWRLYQQGQEAAAAKDLRIGKPHHSPPVLDAFFFQAALKVFTINREDDAEDPRLAKIVADMSTLGYENVDMDVVVRRRRPKMKKELKIDEESPS